MGASYQGADKYPKHAAQQKTPPIPCRTGGPLMNRASGRLVREYYGTRNPIVRLGRLDSDVFYRRADVLPLLTADDWRERGRMVRSREKPLALRSAEPIGVYADWQTEPQ
jgi:hypothetical protein